MRLDRLELIRYGKFTDHILEFPKAACDFHLIIGPNEAGKSTVRNAIQELLFGIARNSPLAFAHPLNTLRLGATLSNGDNKLAFHRTKADKKALRSSTDEVLADNILDPFLGNADRHFFDQMFGLNHDRLIDGGKSILSSTDSIGQTLFQSAAGIDSMSRIRDQLIKERDSLYAPRKSADRAFYIAQAALESATIALKAGSIRVTTWSAASARVDALTVGITEQVALHKQLEIQRSRLERLRRTAPFNAAIQALQTQLIALGDVVELPADAGTTLSAAQANLSIAQQLLTLRTEEENRLITALASLSSDTEIIAAADEVQLLEQQRQRYSAHGRDILSREAEVAQLWQSIVRAGIDLGLASDLGSDSPQAMQKRLPSLLQCKAIDEHALLHGALAQAAEAAQQALALRQDELIRLQTELGATKKRDVAPTLQVSLHQAQAVMSAQPASDRHDIELQNASDKLEAALKNLGPWRKSCDELAAQLLPGQAELNGLERDQQTLQTELRAAARNVDNSQAECDRFTLAIRHYQELHQPTTAAMVLHARTKRDQIWLALKTGQALLATAAPTFEASMHQADQLAERQLDDAKEAAELQAMQHAYQRAVAQQDIGSREFAAVEASLAEFLQRWHRLSVAGGIAGMTIDMAGEWLTKRRLALEAAAMVQSIQAAIDCRLSAVNTARTTLTAALHQANESVVESATLAVLCLQAERHIRAIETAQIRHDALSTQVNALQTVKTTLVARVAAADDALAQWQQKWAAKLVAAGLPPEADVGDAKAALAAISEIKDDLQKIRVLQVDRIEAMQADLADFAVHAITLAGRLDQSLLAASPASINQIFSTRLAHALRVEDEIIRLKAEQVVARTQSLAAHETIETAQAMIAPLLAQAGVDTVDLLAQCITRSDQKKLLDEAIATQGSSLLLAGDGLTTVQLQAELNALTPAEMAAGLQAELQIINVRIEDAVAHRAALAAEKASAEHELSSMAGLETGATAEAQRQEALAQMGEAAERYVRVATAAKLLNWSIERYREEKQGPMLTQASAIFRLLTLGRFKKLYVDFDKSTMTLAGMREGGELVSVAAMSDGTRDQLYFALRMAALELHLGQATTLLFLADDLFINYDDERCKAGLEALKMLSTKTQVIFLSHHDHLGGLVQEVFGNTVNVLPMTR